VFTAKERDQEMGLDYFGARYYGSTLGRWTSPDEFKGGFDNLDGQPAFSPGPIGYADLSDPQTLNMYVYTRNNPLRFIDPDGHDFLDYLSGVADAFVSDNAAGTDAFNFFHPGATNFRGHTSGDPKAIPSTHIPIDPKATLPNNEWHVDGAYPYDGVHDWLEHAGCATHLACDPAK